MTGARAILTGALLGACLSLCNIYSGLKLGWSTSMGISGAILAHFVWSLRTRHARSRSPFSSEESVVAATSAAGAAAVSSTGLVAGVPALALLTIAAKDLDPEVAGLHQISQDRCYLWCPQGVLKSLFGTVDWDRRLGVTVTMRNFSTALKLVEMSS